MGVGPGKRTAPDAGQADEPRFVKAIRAQILQFTGRDIGPDDPIYPILVCMQLMTRAISAENRASEAEEWRRIAASIRESRRTAAIRMAVVGGVCLLAGVGIGVLVAVAVM